MIRREVKSSNIHSIGYDEKEMTLEVQFLNNKGLPGSVYQYWPITQYGYKMLLNAPSIGTYFSKFIKNNPKISYKKIGNIPS